MEKLLRGVRHFRENVFTARREEYLRVANGQNPQALFISCSDSRVDPELLTSSGPGDIFVLRNAGNLIPPHGAGRGGEAATIEYAVTGLGVRNVVVCGHTGCGAMRALLEPQSLASLPMTANWLANAEATRAVVESKYVGMTNFAKRWEALVEENVLTQLKHLHTHPSVAAGIAAGTVALWGWVFDMQQGRIRGYEPKTGQFTALAEDSEPAAILPIPVRPPVTANGKKTRHKERAQS